MNAYRAKQYGYLDRIRVNEGAERCRAVFQEACEKNRRWAAGLLNDSRLTFPCLFLLWRQAEAFQLDRCLSIRSLTALGMIRQMLEPQNTGDSAPYLSPDSGVIHSVHKWILMTGEYESGLSNVHEYEEIVDKAASLLINAYRDKSVLPRVVELVFDRNREDRHVHTLIWALFRAGDPQVLNLIAQRIPAADQRDTEFACSLLNLDSPGETPTEKTKLYNDYVKWLRENTPFLLFTGESPQFSSRPVACALDLGKKYVGAGAGFDRRQFIKEEDKKRYLEAFACLSEGDKNLLSGYSYKRRKDSVSEWNRWISSPVEKQLDEAKAEVF